MLRFVGALAARESEDLRPRNLHFKRSPQGTLTSPEALRATALRSVRASHTEALDSPAQHVPATSTEASGRRSGEKGGTPGGEEDDLLGKMEGAAGRRLCERTQEPPINPAGRPAARVRGITHPGVPALRGQGLHAGNGTCAPGRRLSRPA